MMRTIVVAALLLVSISAIAGPRADSLSPEGHARNDLGKAWGALGHGDLVAACWYARAAKSSARRGGSGMVWAVREADHVIKHACRR